MSYLPEPLTACRGMPFLASALWYGDCAMFHGGSCGWNVITRTFLIKSLSRLTWLIKALGCVVLFPFHDTFGIVWWTLLYSPLSLHIPMHFYMLTPVRPAW